MDDCDGLYKTSMGIVSLLPNAGWMSVKAADAGHSTKTSISQEGIFFQFVRRARFPVMHTAQGAY